MKKTLFIITCVTLLAAGCGKVQQKPGPVACTMEAMQCPDGSYVGRSGPKCEFAACPKIKNLMTEAEARVIAEKSCIKGAEALGAGTYNSNSQTWWYDANLNATRPGCNPACVVSEQTKTAEINWRCTGLIPPSPTSTPPLPVPPPAKTSGINGYIHMGPTCPVEKMPPDPNCADKPYTNAEILAANSAGKQYLGKTDSAGNFSLIVPAGTYNVEVVSVNMFPRCLEQQAIVIANNFVSLNISCDTGIR
jgi:hypothetical protein